MSQVSKEQNVGSRSSESVKSGGGGLLFTGFGIFGFGVRGFCGGAFNPIPLWSYHRGEIPPVYVGYV